MIKLKSILSESYAWERKAGEPLPNMKTVQEKYQRNLKEQEESDPSEPHNPYEPGGSGKPDPMFETDSAESPEERMQSLINIYHMYKDGEVDKRTFYSLVGILPRHEKEELLAYINREKFDGTGVDPDEPMQEAYDAKGVEEAADAKPDYIDADGDGDKKEPMKKAFADKKKKDSVDEGAMCESCGCEPCECDKDETTDESVLNMHESFWGRVKGNLHGHEYILRETFRK